MAKMNCMKSVARHNSSDGASVESDSWVEIVRQQIGSLRFGVVQIVVHESHVVQIERTEKLRVAQSPADAGNRPVPSAGLRQTGTTKAG